ncbi:hypothetical protein EDM68_02680 [Candidatus Uhrbacteria bacterium]|nr:MAG: hypothetical protein EDM68_02680 [Candidatus Uhrbacteria bacterium]
MVYCFESLVYCFEASINRFEPLIHVCGEVVDGFGNVINFARKRTRYGMQLIEHVSDGRFAFHGERV